jgi:hypothetical protein
MAKYMVGVMKSMTPTFLKKIWSETSPDLVRMNPRREIQKAFSSPQKHKTRKAQGVAGFDIW